MSLTAVSSGVPTTSHKQAAKQLVNGQITNSLGNTASALSSTGNTSSKIQACEQSINNYAGVVGKADGSVSSPYIVQSNNEISAHLLKKQTQQAQQISGSAAAVLHSITPQTDSTQAKMSSSTNTNASATIGAKKNLPPSSSNSQLQQQPYLPPASSGQQAKIKNKGSIFGQVATSGGQGSAVFLSRQQSDLLAKSIKKQMTQHRMLTNTNGRGANCTSGAGTINSGGGGASIEQFTKRGGGAGGTLVKEKSGSRKTYNGGASGNIGISDSNHNNNTNLSSNITGARHEKEQGLTRGMSIRANTKSSESSHNNHVVSKPSIKARKRRITRAKLADSSSCGVQVPGKYSGEVSDQEIVSDDNNTLNDKNQTQKLSDKKSVDGNENGSKEFENQKENEDEEAMNMVGKGHDEIQARKIIKEKLKVTKVPNLVLGYQGDQKVYFGDYYDYIRFLGTGSFGFVVAGYPLDTQKVFALKIVDKKSSYSASALQREAEILEQMPQNNNIIAYDHIKEYQNYFIMAIEFAPGGTVAELRKRVKRLPDEQCALLIKHVLLGLKHIHKNNYVHRDIKPSNIVLKSPNDYSSVKLVDFGLAIKYQTRQGIDENCGTLVYQAPEQMAGGQLYGKSVDIWAVGFIMYEMLKGCHPLWAKNETVESYKKKVMNFSSFKYNQYFSPMACNLLNKLCHPKPSQRYTVDQALQHPWITRDFKSDIPRTHLERNIFLDEIDIKLRKVINAVYFLMMVRNHHPTDQTLSTNNNHKFYDKNKNTLYGGGTLMTQSYERLNETSNMADGISPTQLTEGSPLKTCSTSSRIGRYQSDLSMIQRHHSSLMYQNQNQQNVDQQQLQQKHSSSTLTNYQKTKSMDGKNQHKRPIGNPASVSKTQKEGKLIAGKLFIKKSEVKMASASQLSNQDNNNDHSPLSKYTQKNSANRKGSQQRSPQDRVMAGSCVVDQTQNSTEMNRQVTPHFISQKQSTTCKSPAPDQNDPSTTPQKTKVLPSPSMQEEVNLDEFLLQDQQMNSNNIGAANSISDANDSIFGGNSHIMNVSEDKGLQSRRFNKNDCRLALHLNIEKSNKKLKADAHNQSFNQIQPLTSNNESRDFRKQVHNTDSKVPKQSQNHESELERRANEGALDQLVAHNSMENLLQSGRRSQLLHQRNFKDLANTLQKSLTDHNGSKNKSQLIHGNSLKNENQLQQKFHYQSKSNNNKDSLKKSIDTFKESASNNMAFDESPSIFNMINQQYSNGTQDLDSSLLGKQDQKATHRYQKIQNISSKQSMEQMNLASNLAEQSQDGQTKLSSMHVSQDYLINLKPAKLHASTSGNTLDQIPREKSINSTKPPIGAQIFQSNINISSRESFQKCPPIAQAQGATIENKKENSSGTWERQETGGDIDDANRSFIKENVRFQKIVLRSTQRETSKEDILMSINTNSKQRRNELATEKRNVENDFMQKDSNEDRRASQITKSRNGMRRLHKSSGATNHQQRKSEIASKLAYQLGQEGVDIKFSSKDHISKSQKSASSSTNRDNQSQNMKDDNLIKQRKKTGLILNQDELTDRQQHHKSFEGKVVKDSASKKVSKSGAQKKEKLAGSKSGSRHMKKISHKKNSKNQILAIGSQNPREVFESNKLPIGVIKESNLDEEKGTVENMDDDEEQVNISHINTANDDIIVKDRKSVSQLQNDSKQARMSKELSLGYSEMDSKHKINLNQIIDGVGGLQNCQSNHLNDSLPYISQNRSSMSSMTCIQPTVQQMMKKNSSDDVSKQIQMADTYAKHFQSNKLLMDQLTGYSKEMQQEDACVKLYHLSVSQSQNEGSNFNQDKSLTQQNQSFLSKQSHNSQSKSNRDKRFLDNLASKNGSGIDPQNALSSKKQEMPKIKNRNQTIERIIQKIPVVQPQHNFHNKNDRNTEKETQGSSLFQHPARSNTPLIQKQKIITVQPQEGNGSNQNSTTTLNALKHPNGSGVNLNHFNIGQSQGMVNGMSNEKIQNLISGLQRFQNLHQGINASGTQDINHIFQNYHSPQKSIQSTIKSNSVKIATPKEKDHFFRSHLKQLVVQNNNPNSVNKLLPPSLKVSTTQANNKQMRSPLLNGNNNAYIDNPILKKNSASDHQKLLDEANKIIAQRGITSQSLHSINSRQQKLNPQYQPQISLTNQAIPIGKRLQSSQPYLNQSKIHSSAPRNDATISGSRDDQSSPFETFLLNLLQKSSENIQQVHGSRQVPMVISNTDSQIHTKLIPQNIQKLQQFQVGGQQNQGDQFANFTKQRPDSNKLAGSKNQQPSPSTPLLAISAPPVTSQKPFQKVGTTMAIKSKDQQNQNGFQNKASQKLPVQIGANRQLAQVTQNSRNNSNQVSVNGSAPVDSVVPIQGHH